MKILKLDNREMIEKVKRVQLILHPGNESYRFKDGSKICNLNEQMETYLEILNNKNLANEFDWEIIILHLDELLQYYKINGRIS